MSLSALSAAASTVLSTASFFLHGHRKGARPDSSGTSSTSGSTSGITIGQLPVGASTPLFNKILQSLQQTVGAAAVSGATPAATTAGTAGSITATGSPAAGANVQAFMHTLFQALKQDGLGAGAGGPYPSNLVTSLKTLVGQLGSTAAGNPATANLNAAYQNLVSATGPGAATPSAAATGAVSAQASSAGLQNFLNNLLQNLQSGGVQSLSGIGNNVNANV
jgi:hypothetical protein